MRTHRQHRIALAAAACALVSAAAFAQTVGSSISRVVGDVSVAGVTIDDNTLRGPALTPTPESASDRTLLNDLVNALATDPRMSGAQISVEVNDGRVNLGGVVRDVNQSQQARAIADGIAGSANVTNRLTTGG